MHTHTNSSCPIQIPTSCRQAHAHHGMIYVFLLICTVHDQLDSISESPMLADTYAFLCTPSPPARHLIVVIAIRVAIGLFEIASHGAHPGLELTYVAAGDLKLLIHMPIPPSPKSWDQRHAPPRLAL